MTMVYTADQMKTKKTVRSIRAMLNGYTLKTNAELNEIYEQAANEQYFCRAQKSSYARSHDGRHVWCDHFTTCLEELAKVRKKIRTLLKKRG